MKNNINDYTPQVMSHIGDLIKSLLPDTIGFSLVLFEFGEGLREMKYVSNAQRLDMIATFEAMVLKWKQEEIQKN